jgi:hypothetical protein
MWNKCVLDLRDELYWIFWIILQKRSHRADEYIRLVKDHLEVAVKQCTEAAGYEFDTGNQKMLIRVSLK